MDIFGPKPWVNHLGQMSIFRLFELFAFIAQKGGFLFYNIVKDIFQASITKKKRLEKWAFLDQKHGLTPLEKCQIFRLFQLLDFIAQKGVFLFYNIVKDIFLASITQKKKLEKWSFLDQKHGLTPLKKCQFFDFFNFLILQPRKACFCSTILQKTFSWPLLPKKNKLEKWPFLNQKHGLTPLKKCQFFDFLNFLFLLLRQSCFCSRIS